MQQMEGCLVLASTKVEFNHDNHICCQDFADAIVMVELYLRAGLCTMCIEQILFVTKHTSGQHVSLMVEQEDRMVTSLPMVTWHNSCKWATQI